MGKSLTKKKGKLGAYENKETKNGKKTPSLSLSPSLPAPTSELLPPPP